MGGQTVNLEQTVQPMRFLLTAPSFMSYMVQPANSAPIVGVLR